MDNSDMVEIDSVDNFTAEQRKAFGAVISLLMFLNKQGQLRRFDDPAGFLDPSEVPGITQASPADVQKALQLLDRAGMLMRHEKETGKFGFFCRYLVSDVLKSGWTGGCRTLANAYDSDGKAVYSGIIGENSWLEREGYVVTKTGFEDSQSSQITPKGRSAYVVLNLLVPREAPTTLVA